MDMEQKFKKVRKKYLLFALPTIALIALAIDLIFNISFDSVIKNPWISLIVVLSGSVALAYLGMKIRRLKLEVICPNCKVDVYGLFMDGKTNSYIPKYRAKCGEPL